MLWRAVACLIGASEALRDYGDVAHSVCMIFFKVVGWSEQDDDGDPFATENNTCMCVIIAYTGALPTGADKGGQAHQLTKLS